MVYLFAIFFSIVFICFIINLVKKEKLDEKYSILWLMMGGVTLFVSIFPEIITKVANRFNVYYAPSLMFLFAILVIVICVIHITVVITKLNKMIIRLNQELAILKEKNKNGKGE